MKPYRMPRVAMKFEGPSGIATVKFNADKTKVRVDFENEPEPYVLKRSECPEYLNPGEWFVLLTGDKSRMVNARPINGQFVGKVSKFATSGENNPPTPRTFKGDSWEYQYFVVLIEITQGDCAGAVIPYSLRYHFVETMDDDGKNIAGIGHTKSKYTPPLEEFLELSGIVDFGAIPYEDNILPKLEKRALRANREFNLLLKGGWIDKLFPLSGVRTETLEQEDEVLSEDAFAEPAEQEPITWEDTD